MRAGRGGRGEGRNGRGEGRGMDQREGETSHLPKCVIRAQR